jgi:hypothetical protein
MISPDLVSPDWFEIADWSLALLEWDYTDSCTPDNFEIILSKDSSFSTIDHTGTVAGDVTSWSPPVLDQAEEYFWRVRAVDEGTYGPYSTELRSFFTGPVCDPEDLVAPLLVSPGWAEIYDNDYDSLEWSWPLTHCIPSSYRIEVSPDNPSFSDPTYNGGTGNPKTSWGFGITPPEGTQFWWRVTASASETWGPTSLASMFWTAPACAAGEAIPELQFPNNDDVVTTDMPAFAWDFTYPGAPCAPEGFHLQISTLSDMSAVVLDAYEPTTAVEAMMVPAPLDDCHEYYWHVSAISDGVETAFTDPFRFIMNQTGDCGCTEITLPEPHINRPTPMEVFPDTNAIIRWENPGGCYPDGSIVKLADSPIPEDYLLDEYLPGEFVEGYDPPGLDPVTQYWSNVAFAVEDGGVPLAGAYAHRSFFTGPECASIADVAAPILDLPEDGAVVDTLTPLMRYHPGAPGCIPDGYFINLQDDSSFAGVTLLGEFFIPTTAMIPDPPLIDCTMYYWKVAAVQDGTYGPESDVFSFFVNESGTCLPPGVPGTAKSNHFCRAGTYPDLFEALWTIEEGDRVLAVARNPLTTYLKLTILNQETLESFQPEILCWSYIGNFDPGWPETPQGIQYDFKDLQEEEPPSPPPEEEEPPAPPPDDEPVCHENLGLKECQELGGKYSEKSQKCYCP